ncbi:HAD-IA family hydrolase [Methylosinus sp. Sm6]|uniref:HAD-IA family hydrolase n=1 Tax=Methylosinus sp. Sm6 TaxID=2866948 RepID=UPI001C9A0381|nr:HAD-IA family hydrolase [Methylosinus sp. Sm6]MBY6241740.1 HAD-IA family hydrolase [Methylosinus sp. Sm6]
MTGAPILVFDLDGTLADTAGDLIGALGVLLQRDGHAPLPASAARALVGAGARALIQRGYAANGAELAPERLELLFHLFLAHYRERIADETRLFPGALSALERFFAAGYRLAVCTNKPEDLSILLLERLGVASRFSAICGRDSFPFHKPDPRALTQTIARAGGDPSRAVMIGDSQTDIDTAKAAGVPVVAVDFGYTQTPVAEFAPDRVISHFDDLWDAVASLAAHWSERAPAAVD